MQPLIRSAGAGTPLESHAGAALDNVDAGELDGSALGAGCRSFISFEAKSLVLVPATGQDAIPETTSPAGGLPPSGTGSAQDARHRTSRLRWSQPAFVQTRTVPASSRRRAARNIADCRTRTRRGSDHGRSALRPSTASGRSPRPEPPQAAAGRLLPRRAADAGPHARGSRQGARSGPLPSSVDKIRRPRTVGTDRCSSRRGFDQKPGARARSDTCRRHYPRGEEPHR